MKKSDELEKTVEEKNVELTALRCEKSLAKQVVNNIVSYTVLEDNVLKNKLKL